MTDENVLDSVSAAELVEPCGAGAYARAMAIEISENIEIPIEQAPTP